MIVRTQIKDHVTSSCSGTFDRKLVEELTSWLSTELIAWLDKVTRNLKASEILCKERLLYYLYDSFVKLRYVLFLCSRSALACS